MIPSLNGSKCRLRAAWVFGAVLLVTLGVACAGEVEVLPALQARYDANPDTLGRVQQSITTEPEATARWTGSAAVESPEEFRTIAIFRLDDLKLLPDDIKVAKLVLDPKHLMGDKSSGLVVERIDRIPTATTDFHFNSFNMYAEPDGDPLINEAGWDSEVEADITELFKDFLSSADQERGLVVRVRLADPNQAFVDYSAQQILRTSFGEAALAIRVEKN